MSQETIEALDNLRCATIDRSNSHILWDQLLSEAIQLEALDQKSYEAADDGEDGDDDLGHWLSISRDYTAYRIMSMIWEKIRPEGSVLSYMVQPKVEQEPTCNETISDLRYIEKYQMHDLHEAFIRWIESGDAIMANQDSPYDESTSVETDQRSEAECESSPLISANFVDAPSDGSDYEQEFEFLRSSRRPHYRHRSASPPRTKTPRQRLVLVYGTVPKSSQFFSSSEFQTCHVRWTELRDELQQKMDLIIFLRLWYTADLALGSLGHAMPDISKDVSGLINRTKFISNGDRGFDLSVSTTGRQPNKWYPPSRETELHGSDQSSEGNRAKHHFKERNASSIEDGTSEQTVGAAINDSPNPSITRTEVSPGPDEQGLKHSITRMEPDISPRDPFKHVWELAKMALHHGALDPTDLAVAPVTPEGPFSLKRERDDTGSLSDGLGGRQTRSLKKRHKFAESGSTNDLESVDFASQYIEERDVVSTTPCPVLFFAKSKTESSIVPQGTDAEAEEHLRTPAHAKQAAGARLTEYFLEANQDENKHEPCSSPQPNVGGCADRATDGTLMRWFVSHGFNTCPVADESMELQKFSGLQKCKIRKCFATVPQDELHRDIADERAMVIDYSKDKIDGGCIAIDKVEEGLSNGGLDHNIMDQLEQDCHNQSTNKLGSADHSDKRDITELVKYMVEKTIEWQETMRWFLLSYCEPWYDKHKECWMV